jgi:DNA-binding MarR family transcriptional regulator
MTASLSRQESLGYQVNHLARLLAQALAVRIAPHGVVPGQFAQLLALYEEDDLTQRELCDRIRIEQATMANTLQRMQRDGLVDCVPDRTDRRRMRVRLTERARTLEADLAAAARAVNAAATQGLSDEEVADFMPITATVIQNLEGDTRRNELSTPHEPDALSSVVATGPRHQRA